MKNITRVSFHCPSRDDCPSLNDIPYQVDPPIRSELKDILEVCREAATQLNGKGRRDLKTWLCSCTSLSLRECVQIATASRVLPSSFDRPCNVFVSSLVNKFVNSFVSSFFS